MGAQQVFSEKQQEANFGAWKESYQCEQEGQPCTLLVGHATEWNDGIIGTTGTAEKHLISKTQTASDTKEPLWQPTSLQGRETECNVAVVGASGVGKTTLINRMLGQPVDTTRSRYLQKLQVLREARAPGNVSCRTMRSPQLYGLKLWELPGAEEFLQLLSEGTYFCTLILVTLGPLREADRALRRRARALRVPVRVVRSKADVELENNQLVPSYETVQRLKRELLDELCQKSRAEEEEAEEEKEEEAAEEEDQDQNQDQDENQDQDQDQDQDNNEDADEENDEAKADHIFVTSARQQREFQSPELSAEFNALMQKIALDVRRAVNPEDGKNVVLGGA